MHAIRKSCVFVVVLGCLGGPVAGADGDSHGGSHGQSAAALPQLGDKASYATWNADGERWVYGVELRDASTGRLLATAARTPPWTAKALGWRGYGAAYLPSNGVRIPERVGISWWFDLEAARRRDPSSRQGPYVIELRERISPRALAAAASGARRFMLEIGVGAGRVPPVLRWHLLDRLADPPGSVVERGGDEVDWRPTTWR